MAVKKVPAVKKKAAPKTQAKARTKVQAKVPPAPESVQQAHDSLDGIGSVQLTMTAELGRTRQTIESVAGMGDQSLVELDKTAGDPIDVLLNGELFARGEVVAVGQSFGVRVTEIVGRPGD
jgi:flagellar motor switch protein FliN